MFEERMAHFYKTREKFDARVKQLESEKADIEAKIAKAREMYEISLIDDIDDGNRKTQAELSKHLRQAEDLEKQVRDITKRVAHVNQLKNEKLREMLPELHQARNAALEQKRKEVLDCANGAFELKAKTILYFRDLHKPIVEASQVDGNFKTACHLAGDHSYDRDWLSMPTLNLTSTYTGRYDPLVALPQDLTDAFHFGKIPAFVRLYELTGEVLSQDAAIKRLAEMERKG